jgi:hypothetical protein
VHAIALNKTKCIKALFRLYEASIKALVRLYAGSINGSMKGSINGSIKALSRLYQAAITALLAVLRRAVGRKGKEGKKKKKRYTPNTPNTLQYLAQSLGTERAPATAKQKQKISHHNSFLGCYSLL